MDSRPKYKTQNYNFCNISQDKIQVTLGFMMTFHIQHQKKKSMKGKNDMLSVIKIKNFLSERH